MLAGAAEVPEYLPQLTALVVGGALVAYLGNSLRLVPIVAFLVTGVVIGPNALGLVSNLEVVDAAAEVGVLLLLFTIGLEFSLDRLQQMRRQLVLGGGLQVSLAVSATTAILLLAGVDLRTALFSGMLVALSSTAIVLKLLADRGEINTESGRDAVSILLFQDLAIVGMVLLVPVLGESGGSTTEIVTALATAVAIIAGVLLIARKALPHVLERVARTCSPEIFLLSVIAICIGTAYATSLAGVSVSLGAFLAGLIVSESRFRGQALGEVLPLQIVFSATFFVSIGMLLDVGFLIDHAALVLGAVVALFAVKAITTGVAVLATGERVAIAIVAALTLAQVGEFSFVLMNAGAAEGLTPAGLGEDGRQGLIAATVLLMAATPLLIGAGSRLAQRFDPGDSEPELPGRQEPVPGALEAAGMSNHVIVAGYGRWARGLTRVLDEADVPQVIATLSPTGATEAHEQGLPVVLGDPARIGTLNEVGIERAKALIVPDDGVERAVQVVEVARSLRGDIAVIVRTRSAKDVERLERAGASYVVTEEIEATAMLAAKAMKSLGRELDDALARSHAVRGFYRSEDEGPPVRLPQHAVVDTEQTIEVELGPDACAHADDVRPVVPGSAGCEECLRSGDSWVHLRICLTCGHVGCCDSSPNRHARRHHEEEAHHIVRSGEPGESWVYCFADDLMLRDH